MAEGAGSSEVRKIMEYFSEGRPIADHCVELLSSVGSRISSRNGRERFYLNFDLTPE